jgi:hypothetical protein
MEVTRYLPVIKITLSKTPIDPATPGYQVPTVKNTADKGKGNYPFVHHPPIRFQLFYHSSKQRNLGWRKRSQTSSHRHQRATHPLNLINQGLRQHFHQPPLHPPPNQRLTRHHHQLQHPLHLPSHSKLLPHRHNLLLLRRGLNSNSRSNNTNSQIKRPRRRKERKVGNKHYCYFLFFIFLKFFSKRKKKRQKNHKNEMK